MGLHSAVLWSLIHVSFAAPIRHDAKSSEDGASPTARLLALMSFGLGFMIAFVRVFLRKHNGAIRLDESNVSNTSQDDHQPHGSSEMQSLDQGIISHHYKASAQTVVKEVAWGTSETVNQKCSFDRTSTTKSDSSHDSTQPAVLKEVTSSLEEYKLSSHRIEKRGSGQQKGFGRGGTAEDIFLDIEGPTPSSTVMDQNGISGSEGPK